LNRTRENLREGVDKKVSETEREEQRENREGEYKGRKRKGE